MLMLSSLTVEISDVAHLSDISINDTHYALDTLKTIHYIVFFPPPRDSYCMGILSSVSSLLRLVIVPVAISEDILIMEYL